MASVNNTLLYIITVLIWGSTWLAIEYQLGVVPPEVSVFYRFLLAALLLFGWCRYRGLSLRFPAKTHLTFLLMGALLFGINYLATYHAQRFITSALTAIVFSSMLWMNMINSRVFFGIRSTANVLLGSFLGISGIIVLFLPQVGELSLADATLIGGGIAFFAAFLASLGNMVSQRAQINGLPVVQSNAWGMLYGSILIGAIALFSGKQFNFDTSTSYVVSLIFLAIFGTIVAFGAYLTLLGRIGAHRAGYATVMFPVVALILSFLFEGLEPTWNIFAGVALVLLGNVLILKTGKHESPVVLPNKKGQQDAALSIPNK